MTGAIVRTTRGRKRTPLSDRLGFLVQPAVTWEGILSPDCRNTGARMGEYAVVA
jgi:hypothetical protein